MWLLPYFSPKPSGDTNQNEASASTETDGADKKHTVPPKVWNQNFHPQQKIYYLQPMIITICIKYDNLATKSILWSVRLYFSQYFENIFSWKTKHFPFTLIEHCISTCYKLCKHRQNVTSVKWGQILNSSFGYVGYVPANLDVWILGTLMQNA